jgi:2'-5' RNA ligase
MRTFVAIDLDEQLKAALEELVANLRQFPGNVRWANAAGMHLTLKFLGEIPESDVDRVSSALADIAPRLQTFTLVLDGTGAFPPGRRAPRVFWVGVVPIPPLLALQEEVEREMQKLGLERENRRFEPHLTLGRVKSPGRLERLVEEMKKYEGRKFGEMEVRKFTLFRSVLQPSGAEYSVVKEFNLG